MNNESKSEFFKINYNKLHFFFELINKKISLFSEYFNNEVSFQLKNISIKYFEIIDNDNEYNEILLDKKIDQESKIILEKEKEKNILRIEELIKKTKLILLSESNQNILMEIRPGTGGTEASIFARDLYQMYYLFSKKKNWNVEMIESRIDKEGNLMLFSFLVKGEEVFLWLKNEAGVHRVQRIPKTENKGRIHTSTATVAILPEPKNINLKISNQDLKIDTYRSSGAGGQHVNTTDSAIRITHIPTGIAAHSQDGRSQHSNKERAMIILKSRIYEKIKKDEDEKKGNLRSSMLGNAERSEKIRTYNWQQNRLTDHRLKKSWNNLNYFLKGEIDILCEKLIEYDFGNKIDEIIKFFS